MAIGPVSKRHAGHLGGRARARKLSQAELSEQGRKAALARWRGIGRRKPWEKRKRKP